MLITNTQNAHKSGFTIVELLVVIVVIAILAAVTLLGYNGVQDSARRVATESELKTQVNKIKLEAVETELYPASLQAASLPESSGSTTFTYTTTAARDAFCLTALHESGSFSFHQDERSGIQEGPCDGHSGGPKYCPTDTYQPINGFFCDGPLNGVATLNTNAIRLLSSTSPIPSGAPGAYVGRQTTRDNLVGSTFPVTPGEVYCGEGWVSTVDSTVTHGIGLMFYNGTSNSWVLFGRAAVAPATGKWVKIGNCITVPAGIINARFWTQNDGTNGTTAAPAWYHTALRFWKQ